MKPPCLTPRFAVALVVLVLAPGAARVESAPAARPRHFVSAAVEELILDAWSRGRLRDNPVAREIVEWRQSVGAIEIESGHESHVPVLPWRVASGPTPALGRDAIANDRSLGTCVCTNGRPLTQSEPSIAVWGDRVVVSWNDRRGVCPGEVNGPGQGIAWSVDGGRTFTEGALLRGPNGEAFHGDPTVTVNAKTGDFYISGILRQITGQIFGVGAVRGHFESESFVIDTRRIVAVAASGDLLDKPWMAADSVSGNVYITWTNFRTADLRIELQRLDGVLNPLGPIQVLRETPYGDCGPQGTFPTVGPSGELYVPWGWFCANNTWSTPPSRYEVVRSDDFGQTFGPVRVISPFFYAIGAVPPTFQREFWGGQMAMAVDHSNGPHRGRVYAVWSENPDFTDTPLDTAVTVFEQEPNGFFASAVPFVPGARLRGSFNAVEKDFFKFTGSRGQVFVLAVDSVGAAVRVRLLCSADTASTATYHVIGTVPELASGLPYDGTYYLQLDFTSPFFTGNYSFRTGLDPRSPTERSRDIRDQFLSWSDDGTTWSTPVRLNDDPPGFDGVWTSVAVDGQGRVHAFWFDWRDDTVCGTISHQYMTSSGDGGVTWGPNRRLTDASSFWGLLASCSMNNLGDYTQMAAEGDRVYSIFPDSRLGDPDVFVDASTFRSTSSCPTAGGVVFGGSGQVDLQLSNGSDFETPLAWRVSDDSGWLTAVSPAATGSQPVASGATLTVTATLDPPGDCDGDSTTLRFITWDPHIPGDEDTCTTVVRCGTAVSVPAPRVAELALRRVSPNPSRDGALVVSFSLPSAEPATLEVMDIAGRRLVSREVGALGPGPHDLTLSDARLRGGFYVVRLSQGAHRISAKTVVAR